MNGNKQITTEIRVKTILDEAEKDLNKFSESVNQLWKNQTPPKSILKTLEKLKLQLTSMQDIAQKDQVNIIDTNQLESDYNNFQKVLRNIGIEFKLFTDAQKKAMLGTEEAKNIDKQTEALKKYNQVLQKSEEIKGKRKPLLSEQRKNNNIIEKQTERKGLAESAKAAALSQNKPNKDVEEYIAKLEQQKKITEELAILEKNIQAEKLKGVSSKEGANNSLTRQIELQKELKAQLDAIDLTSGKDEYDAYTQAVEKANIEIEEQEKIISDCNDKIEQAENSNKEIQKSLEKLPLPNTKNALNEFKTALKEAGIEGVDNAKTIDELREKINEFEQNALAKVESRLQTTTGDWQKLTDQMDKAGPQIEETNADLKEQNDILANQQAFASRIRQFLGLEGAVNIARSAFRNAFNTIKELDAAMTEMAVVTDLDVGDYWKQLPQHTKDANKLGVAIKDVYEAETLYYQQGLKTNEVTAMSTQTLKMARIAGLSAEDATNKMTAALRGFNMELNETSAQRVADVYSELAAITASDVDEISSAMSKTASIASNAGMEFETTAAFLSQIIETTRESAETAGTALKTVIARFQELKKSPSEIGEVDGEVVDANKIETALRSVGVALRDTNGQFRNLDEVFLELSSKWDGLDTNTQRYIATIAAGSRQQSRFIAMMSDYSRTQELVMAANTSAGASNVQFEKTMDSLEAKLNKLKNAWDSFTMDIMNSNVIKAGVDILTALLTTINKITDAFGDFGGVAKIGMLVTALHLGEKALNVFNTSLQQQKGIWGSLGQVGKSALTGIRDKLVSLSKTIKSAFGKESIISGLSKKELKEMGDNLKNYTNAAKNNSKATEKMNKLALQGKASTQQYADAQKLATNAAAQQAAAEASLSSALGLSTSQIKTAAAMTELGVGADNAAILSKAGITTQNLLAAASFDKEKISTVSNTLAKKLENAGTLRLLSTKIGLTVANWAHNASQKAEEGSTWAIITAKIAETAVNWGLNASMAPLLLVTLALVLAIGALIGVVVLIVKAFKKWKASQPEAQLAALEEKTQKAKETAQETKEAYDELKTAVEGYQSLLKTVDSLTEGTTAWKDAVADLNESVTELITNFPKLAQYLEVDEAGHLILNPTGLENYINDENTKVALNNFVANKRETDKLIAKKESFDTEKIRTGEIYFDYQGNIVSKEQATTSVAGHDDVLQSGYEVEYLYQDKYNYNIGNSSNPITIDWQAEDGKIYELDSQAVLRRLSKLEVDSTEYGSLYGALMDSIESDIDSTQEEKEKWIAELKRFDEDATAIRDSNTSINSYKILALDALDNNLPIEEQNNFVLNSLIDQYDSLLTQANTTTYTEQEKKKLTKEELAQQLLELGGTEYSAEDLKGKTKDDLINEINNLEIAKFMKTQVDNLYSAIKQDPNLQDLYSGTLEVDTTTIDTDKITDTVVKNAIESRKEEVKKQQEDAKLDFTEIFGIWGNDLAIPSSVDMQKKAVGIYRAIKNSNNTVGTLFSALFGNFSTEKQEKFITDYGDVDWGSSVEGYAAIQEMLKSDDEALVEFANIMLKYGEEKYSAVSLFKDFYTSMSQETLDDLMEDGKITGEEILELAKDNKALTTILNITGESASAVADYFMDIASGVITADEATKEYYENLKKENFLKYIQDDFDFKVAGLQFSPSSIDSFGKINEFRTSAIDLHEKGAYNDPTFWQYVRTMFDESYVQERIEQLGAKKAADFFIAQMKQMTNSYNTWKSLGIKGISVDKNGGLSFDMNALGGQQGLLQAIKDKGYNELMAKALIAEAGGFTTSDNTFNTGTGIVKTYSDKDSQTHGIDNEEQETYKSAYDWFFALNQDIEDTVRQREKLERRYARILKEEGATSKEFSQIYTDILASLNTEITQQNEVLAKAKEKMNEIYNEEVVGTSLKKWIKINSDTQEVEIDLHGYEDYQMNDEMRKKFDEIIAKILELKGVAKDAEDKAEDAIDELAKKEEEQKESTSNILTLIKEGIIKERQEQIDKLSEINDTVKDAQDSLVNKIQQQIDEDRQARDNEKRQTEISDKETRLAYLMRDSSGANAMEIARLQKEIREAKEDYGDTLVDQSIQKLSDASAEAAEQRERQIELLQEQLDIYSNSQWILSDAIAILMQGVSEAGWYMGLDKEGLKYLDFMKYVYLADDYNNLNLVDKDSKDEDYFEMFTEIRAYEDELRKLILNRDDGYWYSKRYASGGLADFTGPAWLDGSKTHPELVLNAKDTQNFIQLKNILSDIMNSTPEKTGSSGDNYFDIDIQVESIQDDYDVEQLADKIKGIIYEDSIYRNVNSINSIR